MKKQTLAAALALTIGANSYATAAPAPAVPVPPEVGAAVIVVQELLKPKPFCKVIKIFKKKKKC